MVEAEIPSLSLADTGATLSEELAELERILAEVNKKAEYLERREVPIPDTLYHATNRGNIFGIMDCGLEPKPLYFNRDVVVSMSDDPFFALFVASETQNVPIEKLILLSVNTLWLNTRHTSNYLRSEDPDNPNPIDAATIHEVHYHDVIDSRALAIQQFYVDPQTQSIILTETKPLPRYQFRRYQESSNLVYKTL